MTNRQGDLHKNLHIKNKNTVTNHYTTYNRTKTAARKFEDEKTSSGTLFHHCEAACLKSFSKVEYSGQVTRRMPLSRILGAC